MRYRSTLITALLLCFGVACADAPTTARKSTPKAAADNDDEGTDDKDDTSSATSTSTKTDTTTSEDRVPASPGAEGEPAAPAAPAVTYPRAAGADDCKLGSGLYCGGNGVDGDLGTLFRCKDGSIDVEKKCATSCLSFKDGVPDACDGDATKCPSGAGTYCGGNGVSGDPKTLYRCNAGAVTVEKACDTACTKVGAGKTDKCE